MTPANPLSGLAPAPSPAETLAEWKLDAEEVLVDAGIMGKYRIRDAERILDLIDYCERITAERDDAREDARLNLMASRDNLAWGNSAIDDVKRLTAELAASRAAAIDEIATLCDEAAQGYAFQNASVMGEDRVLGAKAEALRYMAEDIRALLPAAAIRALAAGDQT